MTSALRRLHRRATPLLPVLLIAFVAGCGGSGERPVTAAGPRESVHGERLGRVRISRITYRAHDGRARGAYLVAPAWYGPARNPRLPLIVSPHGRGVDGRANARLWGQLPARGRFLVISPDGEGEHLPLYSWGAPGQVADLATMPRKARAALPWLRIAPRRIYAVGGSMGGQEVLLLVARTPRLLAGAAAFDAPTDLTLQYRAFPRLPCNAACLRLWKDPIGEGLQTLAREEIGGAPEDVPQAYAERSPVTHAAAIARSRVPLQLWWSRTDVVVSLAQQKRFVRALERSGAPRVTVVRGSWPHVEGLRLNLTRALRRLGLLP